MPAHDTLDEDDDDYVANLLKQDAANMNRGISVARRSPHAPRANTRFLQNILRDTSHHNAALLAREQREARRRQEKATQKASGRLSPPSDVDRPARSSSEPSRKKRRDRRSSREEQHTKDKKRKRDRSHSPDRHRLTDSQGYRERPSHLDNQQESSRHDRNRPQQRKRSPKGRSNESHQGARDASLGGSSGQSKRSKPRSRRDDMTNRRDMVELPVDPEREQRPTVLQRRGRGVFSTREGASIDRHFGKQYDPTTDLQAEVEEGADWDEAVDAMRARAQWRSSGASRLKAAGFTDEAISTWQKGGRPEDEGDIDSVRWRSRAEGREWDRGKVMKLDSDDTKGMDVELRPSWNVSMRR